MQSGPCRLCVRCGIALACSEMPTIGSNSRLDEMGCEKIGRTAPDPGQNPMPKVRYATPAARTAAKASCEHRRPRTAFPNALGYRDEEHAAARAETSNDQGRAGPSKLASQRFRFGARCSWVLSVILVASTYDGRQLCGRFG